MLLDGRDNYDDNDPDMQSSEEGHQLGFVIVP